MKSSPLAIVGIGACTPLGPSIEATALALRARLAAFTLMPFPVATEPEPVIAAPVPGGPAHSHTAESRLVGLAARAIADCLRGMQTSDRPLTLALLLPEDRREHPGVERGGPQILRRIGLSLNRDLRSRSFSLTMGGAGLTTALMQIRDLGHLPGPLLVVGVDSLLAGNDIGILLRSFRLKREIQPEGVIPGEGAVALALSSQPIGDPPLAWISGVGRGVEPDAVLDDKRSSGKGLEQAIHAALVDSGRGEPEIGWRISSMNGERYRTLESILASSRAYRTRRPHFPVWHPADGVGEMGSAAGTLQLALATYALHAGFAPSPIAMVEASSEDGCRGAVVVEAADNRSDRYRGRVGASGTSSRTSSPFFPSVLEIHAGEAGFLPVQRRRVATLPDVTPSRLLSWDERIVAHLDALRVAGDAGFAAIQGNLKDVELDFAATVCALSPLHPDRWEWLATRIAAARTPSPGVAAALTWLDDQAALDAVGDLHRRGEPMSVATALMGVATCLLDPGGPLETSLAHPSPGVVRAACHATGRLRRRDLASPILSLMRHPDPEVALAAAIAAGQLGLPDAWEPLMAAATSRPDRHDELVTLATRVADPWRGAALVVNPDSLPLRTALVAIGTVGDPRGIPWLLEKMRLPSASRPAAEAFCFITGADLDRDKLGNAKREGYEPGPNDDPNDPNVAMNADDDLLWPFPEAVSQWWRAHSRDFQAGTRYLNGSPASPASVLLALREGGQRLRHQAALEDLRWRLEGPVFDVEAPVWRQQRTLATR